MLDTCYSGKTFVAIPGYSPARTRSLTRHRKEVEYSASLSQEALAELALKAKDAKTTRIVIVSASETEESMESTKENGGLFTQTYIAALKNAHDYADTDQAKPSVIHQRAHGRTLADAGCWSCRRRRNKDVAGARNRNRTAMARSGADGLVRCVYHSPPGRSSEFSMDSLEAGRNRTDQAHGATI